ncbi:MAG: phytanoyl-CoA dioxygenase family protein [Chloroflexota bacterium]
MVESTLTQHFQQNGYAVARGLFSEDEIAMYKQHYMDLRHNGEYEGDFAGVQISDGDINKADPLQQYPRMIHMHRWDETTLAWLLDDRIRQHLNAFLGNDPYAVQSMLYFKPPGARGQALHQDQYYLRARPGTCVAAWLALDDCDENNGCLQVVPSTGDLPVLCAVQADTTESFTDVTVPLSEEMQPEAMKMDAGDMLFFNGSVIHGSFSNRTESRFRRSLIGHYVTAESENLTSYTQPMLTFAGDEKWLDVSPMGGACGVWVDNEVSMVER